MIPNDIKKKVQKQAMELTMKMMADDRTRPYMAKAMQGFMQGRQSLVERRRDILKNLSLASKEDLDTLRRETGKLNRQLASLGDKLTALEAQL